MKINKARLSSIIRREMDNCIGLPGGELSRARTNLKNAYYGAPYDVDSERAEKDLSTSVDRSVLEVVEWAKGPLLRVFASNEELIRFDPNGPEDEQYARDATDYINQIVIGRNAFDLVYGPISDCLYQRVGWAKVFFEDEIVRTVRQELSGLSEEEALIIIADSELTPDLEATPEKDGKTGLYSVKIESVRKKERIKILPIPSERVIISQDAVSMENARFVAHWEDRLAGDLKAEGYAEELIKSLPGERDEYMEERAQRLVNSEDGGMDQENASDGSRLIRVYEAYVHADAEGNGELKRLKITYAGDRDSIAIMEAEEWNMDRPPVFSVSSVPLPYSPVGMCIADLVLDIQRIRTEEIRALLDNLFASNQNEWHVNCGQGGKVKWDDFLNRRAGAVYRSDGEVTVTPLPPIPISPAAIAGLELSEKAKEQRTGIGMSFQGLSADALQNTASGAEIQEEAQNIRLELIARIIAESFFKPIGKYALALAHKNIKNPIQIRRQGFFNPIHPFKWNPEMSVTVSVGLGTGSRKKRAQAMQAVMAIQKDILSLFGPGNSPIRSRQIYSSASKYIGMLGLEAAEQYLGTLEEWETAEKNVASQPPQPNIDEMRLQLEARKAEAKAILDRRKAQAEIQNDAAKARADMEIRIAELRQKGMLSQRQMELEAELDAIKLATSLPDVGTNAIAGINTL